MSIEFRCQRCQKLLRTPDGSGGKQAQCPHCGELQTVPEPTEAPPYPTPAAGTAQGGAYVPRLPQYEPTSGNPFSPSTPPGNNPYQSPQATFDPQYAAPPPRIREGPPWEVQGPSPASFWQTMRSFASDIAGFFSSMRLHGGIGLPLLYMLIAGAIGGMVQVAQQVAMTALRIGVANMNPGMGNQPDSMGYVAGMFLGGTCGFVVVVVLMSFITAAVYHLALSLLGGAQQGFEATYRVVAYSSAHSFLLYVIPCCGVHLGSLAGIVFPIIGLACAHETSGWRAAGAVLLPSAVCCLVGVGIGVALIGMRA